MITPIALVMVFALGAKPALAVEVTFPDPALEAAVRAELNIPEPTPVTDTDMARLVVLDASDLGISNLSGLEYATNLAMADLSNNGISDLSPLSGDGFMGTLNLSSNQIADISPLLAERKFFQVLDLGHNLISDVSPLDGVQVHDELRLNNNQITDISPFSRIFHPWSILDLSSNQIRDVSPLSVYTIGTDVLLLDNNLISDISPLVGFGGTDMQHSLSFTLNYLDLSAGSSTMALIEEIIYCEDPHDEFSMQRMVGYLPQKAHAQQASELCAFAESAAASGDLVGAGKGRPADAKLQAFIGKLDRSAALIEQARYAEALSLLQSTYDLCDGQNKPGDFVGGTARQELALKLGSLIQRSSAEMPH